MKQLRELRQDNPMIEPVRRPPANTIAPTTMPVDPRVMGVAPGMETPKLRREGEFVISRRGRMIRAGVSGGGASGGAAGTALFVFEADSEKAQEPPMIILPSQMLQSMEDLTLERGDKIVFIISGQIFTYHGANYLLPTVMKLALDQGNLVHWNESMKISVDIPAQLFERAAELTGVRDRSELARLGLETLTSRFSGRRLAALGGTERQAKSVRRRRSRES